MSRIHAGSGQLAVSSPQGVAGVTDAAAPSLGLDRARLVPDENTTHRDDCQRRPYLFANDVPGRRRGFRSSGPDQERSASGPSKEGRPASGTGQEARFAKRRRRKIPDLDSDHPDAFGKYSAIRNRHGFPSFIDTGTIGSQGKCIK